MCPFESDNRTMAQSGHDILFQGIVHREYDLPIQVLDTGFGRLIKGLIERDELIPGGRAFDADGHIIDL